MIDRDLQAHGWEWETPAVNPAGIETQSAREHHILGRNGEFFDGQPGIELEVFGLLDDRAFEISSFKLLNLANLPGILSFAHGQVCVCVNLIVPPSAALP